MRFSEVIGQEEVKQRLLQMVSEDRLPHAIMLCGPAGVGKKALAIAFACYLLEKRRVESGEWREKSGERRVGLLATSET
jgi:DNA polymerase III gamma/tau subunit